MYYSDDEDLSATLSAGRSTSGYVYFTVPEDAQEIEVEYTTNYLTEDKITFLYEGEQDSGYVLEGNTAATDETFSVGDVLEAGDLTITYISCETDTSYDEYYEPRNGYHYVTCTFEFENAGGSDEYISQFDFDCYADGISCDASYFRDDSLDATISNGRKTQGTVTFEVPDEAAVVEVEYLTNYWTSNRICVRLRGMIPQPVSLQLINETRNAPDSFRVRFSLLSSPSYHLRKRNTDCTYL